MKALLLGIVFVLTTIFGVYFYHSYSIGGQMDKNHEKFVEQIQKARESAQEYERLRILGQKKEEELLRQDTYGGKTPQETLDMFVAALKKKDYKLAAKYYLPWKQREAKKDLRDWIENYPDTLSDFIEAFDKNIIEISQRTSGITVKILKYENDKYPYLIDMQLNNINDIWKIEKFY